MRSSEDMKSPVVRIREGGRIIEIATSLRAALDQVVLTKRVGQVILDCGTSMQR